MIKLSKKLLLSTALIAFCATPGLAATDNTDPEMIIKDGEFFGHMRYRNEKVDQDGVANDADAHTVRTNLGFKTGKYRDFQALIEGQLVTHLNEEFNDTTNGNGTFPVVADPAGAELNQLWLSWDGLPQTTIKVGRQKINLDNQRFVGTVNWRQNDQTFDGVTVTNSSIDNLNLFYSYVGNVNRIFGEDAALGDLDSTVHLANASYKFADWLKLTGYGYWTEFDLLAARSSQTYGARATGKIPMGDKWSLGYEAEYATQEDYANNTADYNEDYYHIAPSITFGGLTLKGGIEVLEGNGTTAFQTPLATLHKFNGWADAFLNTPANGLEDTYIGATYKVPKTGTMLDGIKLKAVYHDFEGEEGGDFGDETDFLIGKTFTLPDAGQPFKKLNVAVKYADFNGENGLADREKFWLQFAVNF